MEVIALLVAACVLLFALSVYIERCERRNLRDREAAFLAQHARPDDLA